MTFKCRENLIVDLYKEDENGVELLNSHRLDSITTVNQSSFKISLTFEINPIEIVKLNEVKYLYSKDVIQSYTEKVRKAVNKTKEAEADSDNSKE